MSSLASLVGEAVLRRGTATVDDIAPLFPCTDRHRLNKALCNAKNRGLIRLITKGRGKGRNGGSTPGTWGAPLPKVEVFVRIASVWELGAPVPPYPLPAKQGRQYQPLGGWDEGAAA
jgi:hypothetical protein